jgi:hypothetical protein
MTSGGPRSKVATATATTPALPAFLRPAYTTAIDSLARLGLRELPRVKRWADAQAILAVVALWKGARTVARVLHGLPEDELREVVTRLFVTPPSRIRSRPRHP